MISLKCTKTVLTTTKHTQIFQITRIPKRINSSTLCFCKSTNESDPPQDGDPRQQEYLARIVQLQTEKVRLSNYLDTTSANLTKFAEEEKAEFDQIGENARKELEESSRRIMEKLDSQMEAFEEISELNRLEIERSDEELAEFEAQIQKDKNEGLFFKNLGNDKPILSKEQKEKAKEETKKIREVTLKKAGSVTRLNIYLALIGLVSSGIVNFFISSSSDWRRLAILAVILVGLITQFIYEQKLLSDTETSKQEKSNDD